MKIELAILAFLLLPALAWGQQTSLIPEQPAETDPHQTQIQAATADGISHLRDQVLAMKLSGDTTVAGFLSRTKSTDDLNTVLNAAQTVGGPRWMDDYLCQIRVELPAAKVSAFLMLVAKDDARHGGIKPDALRAKLADWKDLKFTAVGSSTGGDQIEQTRPNNASGKWLQVNDLSRRKAIFDARSDAMQQVVKSLGPVLLDGKKPVSEALAQPVISQRFDNWLNRQPVTKIQFMDDLKVSVTLSIPPKSMTLALKSAVQADAAFNRGLNVDWAKVGTAVVQIPGLFAGTASAAIEAPSTTLPVVNLPIVPQEGIDVELDAEGSASGGNSRLKVSLAAETDAVAKIREKFLMLHLDSKTTLGDAAKKDANLNPAIDRAIRHAKSSRVSYNTDGSVRVQISLDVRDAWDEIRSNP